MSDGIAAIVVSYNSEEDLPGCLDALCGAAGVDRIIVVDNGSSDASREVVRGLDDSRVGLVELRCNSGFAGGCNRGFAELAAETGCLAVVNPDVTVSRECLAVCREELEREPAIAAVAPRLMRRDGVTVDSVGQVLSRTTLEVVDRGYGGPLRPRLLERRPVLAACGALAVLRPQALRAVSSRLDAPWAEHFFCFWEDLELGWRLSNRGWKVVAQPAAMAVHGRGAGARSGRGPLRWRRPAEIEACVLTNRWMTLARHLHPLDLLARLPLLLVWDLTLLSAGVARRPSLLAHVRRRWPLVVREWKARRHHPRRRLIDLPC